VQIGNRSFYGRISLSRIATLRKSLEALSLERMILEVGNKQ
jgi:hypothetical protein